MGEEAVAVMGVEVAAVTIEKPATISIWYCTQLPFYDIYYVSRFNTCKHVTKLLIHFISSFSPLLFIQMKLCSTTNQVFIFILNSIDNKENNLLSTFERLHLNQYKIQTY